ncbi:MAG: ABC transporter substrate-binding protein [Proteobacteria bacterium]|jgi:branched-chain amino acid transport system substrate-binding protein|nr:ABC transporter substrate-binding protein [Desulfocapsa sp.]MBU3945860.1 ABC transporter substrate-binding protein [Pseudomonadota bacterium]MCG2745615.1 ABC transporter substrate-binding protein [Desulfobacteraceae bacterium]MBU4027707.1 ABC transporter substrate-binding protein [Pseudomonadota bacterium]MBU4042564.1 ABC transporter substrate-binding protein [Pseudomonadota bacterium]
MKKKTALLWYLLLLLPTSLSVLLGACNPQPEEPIKIGLSINLSGSGGEAGEHIRNGALLAVDEINVQGGIHGRPLMLLVRDDENTDEGILKADTSLLAEKVIAIIGHSYSSNTVKAYPLVTSQDTLLITAYTGVTKLSGKDDLFFRTCVDCKLYGVKTAAQLKSKGITSVSVLMDMKNADFVEDYVEQLQKNYQGTVTMVQIKSKENIENIDWQQLASEMLAPNPEAVLLLTESSMTAVAAQKLRELKFNGPLIASIWAQSPELLRIGGPAVEGLFLASFVNPENQRPEYLRFSKELNEKFHKTATARADRAYEMVKIIADALKRSKTIDSQSLKIALLQGEYESILGPVKFDNYGDVVRPVYEVIVRDGRFVNGGEIK